MSASEERPSVAEIPREHPELKSSGAFPRHLRLRRSRDFRRIQRIGVRGHFESLIVIVRPCRKGRGRVGLTVSKKVGNAVMRTKIKRRLRHILREKKALFLDFDVVVVAHPKAAGCTFLQLQSDLEQAHCVALNKLQKRKTGRRKRGGKRATPVSATPTSVLPDAAGSSIKSSAS